MLRYRRQLKESQTHRSEPGKRQIQIRADADPGYRRVQELREAVQ